MAEGLEIERKYLVDARRLPELPPGAEIRQAYLGFDPVVRVRLVGGRGVLTVKGPGLLSRREVESDLDPRAAEALLELRAPGTDVIRKTRHRLRVAGRTWEVDVFGGHLSGLHLAEVELDSADEAVDPPAWVRREVTGDAAYQNANLARFGRPRR